MTALILAAAKVTSDPPSVFTVIWAVAIVLTVLAAGVVTGLKGRWGWLLAGWVTAGALWLFAAMLPAMPGSRWEQRRSGDSDDSD